MTRRLIVEENAEQSIFDLIDEVTVIGRDTQCDLALNCDRLSRKHFKITVVGNDLVAEDLGSSNGTKLNGASLDNKTLLEPGDCLALGGIKIWVDHAPARSQGAGPPATRRAAGDRKAKTNSLRVVLGVVAILGTAIWGLQPDEEMERKSAKGDDPKESAEDSPEAKNSTAKDSPPKYLSATTPEERERLRRRGQALSDLDFEVQTYLLQDDFLGATDALDRFAALHGKPSRSIKKAVDKGINKAYQALLRDYQKQVNAGTGEVALAFIRQKLSQFPTSSKAHQELSALLARPQGKMKEDVARESISSSKQGITEENPDPVNPPIAKVRTKSKSQRDEAEKNFITETTLGDQYFGQRRYEEAALSYRRASEAGFTAQVDHELLRISNRRMRQSLRLSAFVKELESRIAEDPESFGTISFLPGRKGNIVGLGENGFQFSDAGTIVEMPFRVLRSETIKTLIRRANFSPQARIHAATFLLSMSDPEVAEKMLHQSETQAPNLKREIDGVLADARSIDTPSAGFTFQDGRYLSPADVARVSIKATVDEALPKLKSSEAEVRNEGYTALRALGDRAASSYHRALIEAKTSLLADLKAMDSFKNLSRLDEKRLALDKSRNHALELIFDTYKYPYPYRGVSTEISKRFYESAKEVLIRVNAVRELWADEKRVKIDAALRTAVTKIHEYNLELDRLELGRGMGDPRCLMNLPKTNYVSLQSYAIDPADRERLDLSQAWMERNATMESKATAEEKRQVKITNQYRLMFGRYALQLHPKLLACARMHSNDMAAGGFFAHQNPRDPKKKTPNDRARLSGFYGGVSENIAANGGGAIGAHKAWIGSSGHHRNILNARWRYMGSGNSGKLWTQNFSRGDRSESEKPN